MSEPTPATPTPTESTPAEIKPEVPAPAPEQTPAPVVGGKKGSKKNGGKSKKIRKLNNGAKMWNDLVSQVFKDGKAKNPNYKFKQALKDASKLKKKNNKTAKK